MKANMNGRSASSRSRTGPFVKKERRNVKKKLAFALCTALMLCSLSLIHIYLLTYLRRFEPEELVHIGGDTYATRTHDSLKISNGKWLSLIHI